MIVLRISQLPKVASGEPIVVFFLVSSQVPYQPGKLANQVTTLILSSNGVFTHHSDCRLPCFHQLCMVIFVFLTILDWLSTSANYHLQWVMYTSDSNKT